ncbi:MAG: branched-chain amino acid transaminase [Clostridia bacterium]|nr:branched-chain amino acid transaminase [Clostridia bacterium]
MAIPKEAADPNAAGPTAGATTSGAAPAGATRGWTASKKKEIEGGLAFWGGRIVPLSEANVNIATHALNYGTGCFEGIRAYWVEEAEQLYLLKLPEHYRRFMKSCALLRIECPYTVEELCAWTVRLLREGQVRHDAYVRPLGLKASRVIGVGLSGLRDEFGIFYAPLGNYVAMDGLRACVSPWQRISDNAVPSRSKTTGSYVNISLAVDQARRDGYDEAILLNAQGHVSEASGANIFLVRNGRLITPPVTEDILEGITREAVMDLATALGIPVEERVVDRTELYVADEIFLTGTAAQVAPVTSVDGRPVGDGRVGPISRRLQEAYLDAVRGRNPAYASWLTPVYER